MVSQEQFDLSLKESNALKGVALILLLIHHLFYIQNGLYDDVHLFGTQINFVLIFANVCKVCVAIFVLLSGYACAKTVEIASAKDVVSFYRRRFKKLFVNYWFIWLLFVPAGVFIFDRTFHDVYAEPVVRNFLLDFFGLINATGQLGYNATWWFYSCIIMLYALFPLIAYVESKWPWSIIVLLPASAVLAFVRCKYLMPISSYLFPFVVGTALGSKYITHRFPAVYKLMGGGYFYGRNRGAVPAVGIGDVYAHHFQLHIPVGHTYYDSYSAHLQERKAF